MASAKAGSSPTKLREDSARRKRVSNPIPDALKSCNVHDRAQLEREIKRLRSSEGRNAAFNTEADATGSFDNPFAPPGSSEHGKRCRTYEEQFAPPIEEARRILTVFSPNSLFLIFEAIGATEKPTKDQLRHVRELAADAIRAWTAYRVVGGYLRAPLACFRVPSSFLRPPPSSVRIPPVWWSGEWPHMNAERLDAMLRRDRELTILAEDLYVGAATLVARAEIMEAHKNSAARAAPRRWWTSRLVKRARNENKRAHRDWSGLSMRELALVIQSTRMWRTSNRSMGGVDRKSPCPQLAEMSTNSLVSLLQSDCSY